MPICVYCGERITYEYPCCISCGMPIPELREMRMVQEQIIQERIRA